MTTDLSFPSADGGAEMGAQRLGCLTRGLVALVVAAVLLIEMSRPLTADVSWLMTVAERMGAGQRLYLDILEFNPPMCALLYLPSVWLGQVLHIAPEGIVVASVLALALAEYPRRRSAILAGHVAPRSLRMGSRQQHKHNRDGNYLVQTDSPPIGRVRKGRSVGR